MEGNKVLQNDNDTGNKRIAKNSVFLTFRMVVVLIISLYTTRVLLEVLGVEDYGVYNVVCGFVNMFAFMNSSLANGIQRFFNVEYGKNGIEGANKVYNVSLIIQLVLAILVFVVIEIVGLWYIPNKMVLPEGRLFAAQIIFQFVVFGLVLSIMQAPYNAAVVAHERMDFFAIVSILDTVLKLAIVFCLKILKGDSLIWYGMLWMFVSVLNLLIYIIYCKKNFEEIKIKKKKERSLYKEMLGFSGWNLFGTISSVLREQGTNLILNFFYGTVVNAARGVANQINGGIQSFVQNITLPVRPQVMKSFAQNDLERTMNLTYSISKFSCFFITMLAIPVCLEIDFILQVWLGNNIPTHTKTFAIIIILCSFQGNLNGALSTLVHASGKMKKYQFWCSLTKILSVPCGYILLKNGLIPEFALIAIFVFDWLGHIVGLFIVRSLMTFSVRKYVKKVILPIFVVLSLSLLVIAPLHFLINNELVRFILMCCLSVIIVGFISYYLGLEKKERDLFNNILVSIKSRVFYGR